MTPDHSDTAARTVGRYEILGQVGLGGMATVYLARQPGLDRDVALKELNRFGAADQRVFASRFVREAQLAGSLSHPNIVTVLDYFEHDGRPYIAMEYLGGGSLRDYLGTLSMAQVMGVLEGLLAALTHAESRGIVHRDIKPENILVSADGAVKLTDFGIAKAYNAALSGSMLTLAGTTVGTPKYMAPEQGTGKPLSAGTDLYAVGVVAYELLVGRVPFDSDENPMAIVWQHVNDPLPDPLLARPDLDPRLCRWVAELLAKDPADRPPSARAALDALEEIVLDMLGGRWRRAARLSAPQASPADGRPLTPARVESVVDRQAAPGAGSYDEAVADAAQGATLAPRALRDLTETFRSTMRERRARVAPASAAPPARRRRRVIVPLAGLALVAAILGFALFAGDEPQPGPDRSAAAAAAAQAAASRVQATKRQRFVVAMTPVVERLGRAQGDALARLRQARTSPAQAKVAGLIARAYRDGATQLSRLTPGASQADAASAVRSQLRRTARHYSALAAAAARHWPKRYEAATRAIAADEAKLNRLVARIPA